MISQAIVIEYQVVLMSTNSYLEDFLNFPVHSTSSKPLFIEHIICYHKPTLFHHKLYSVPTLMIGSQAKMSESVL